MKNIIFLIVWFILIMGCTKSNPFDPETDEEASTNSTISLNSTSSSTSTPQVVDSVTISRANISCVIGSKETITALSHPSTLSDRSVTWVSSDPNTVEVVNGAITAKKPGTVTITARASLDITKTSVCTVVVSNIELHSTSFSNNGVIPERCGGNFNYGPSPWINTNHGNKSPQFSWRNVPVNTLSYFIIMRHIEGSWYTWGLYNIPVNTTNMGEAVTNVGVTARVDNMCTNAYIGPIPFSGINEHYTFTIYALNVSTVRGMSISNTVDQVLSRIQFDGNILASSTYYGWHASK